jgi:hypothetical protein
MHTTTQGATMNYSLNDIAEMGGEFGFAYANQSRALVSLERLGRQPIGAGYDAARVAHRRASDEVTRLGGILRQIKFHSPDAAERAAAAAAFDRAFEDARPQITLLTVERQTNGTVMI